MSAEAIVAISAAVVAFVQLVKWAGLKDHWGPIVVIAFSGVGVLVWLISQPTWPPARTDTWEIFAAWIAVALSAAGVFGFTRAGAMAVTRATAPPDDGAGSSATNGNAETLEDRVWALPPHDREKFATNLADRAEREVRARVAGEAITDPTRLSDAEIIRRHEGTH